MSDDANLKIKMSVDYDGEGAKKAASDLEKVKNTAKGTNTESQGAGKSLRDIGKATESLKSTVFTLGAVGTAIGGGILKATTSYINQAGMANSTSRQWLAASYQLEQSYLRLGKVGSQQVLPWLQKAAEYADKAAGWAEQNPELVKVGAAAGVIGLGTTGVVGGISTLQKIGKLFGLGAAGAGAAAGAAGTGAAGAAGAGAAAGAAAGGLTLGGVLLSILGGLGGGLAGNEAIANTEWGKNAGVQKGGVIATVVAKGLGDLFAGLTKNPDLGNELAAKIAEMTGVVPQGTADWTRKDQNQNQQGQGDGNNFVTTSMLSRMRQMDIQEKYAQEDYQRTRFKATRDFYRQQGFDEDDFHRSRNRSNRDFNMQMAYSEQMFYRQRAISQRDFQISLQRAEYDYELSRKRRAEDYNFSLKQIMLSGDALQYYYAKRQYQIDEQRAEEDYQLQKERSQEDFARQQSDSLAQFNIERAFQLKQYQIRLADENQDFEIRRKRSKEMFEIQMSDMEYDFKRERNRRWEAFKESILPEIQTEAQYRATMEKSLTATMVNNFNSLMSKFASGWSNWIAGLDVPGTANTSGSKAEYGYASGGYIPWDQKANVHSGEFVMTKDTTRAAETIARSRLSQNNILALMAGAMGGGKQQTNNFYSGVSPDQMALLDNQMHQFFESIVS